MLELKSMLQQFYMPATVLADNITVILNHWYSFMAFHCIGETLAAHAWQGADKWLCDEEEMYCVCDCWKLKEGWCQQGCQ